MLYYKFTIECGNIEKIYTISDNITCSNKINIDCQRLNEKQDYNVFFMVSKIDEKTITLCAAIGSRNSKDAKELAVYFASGLGLDVKSIEGGEILTRKFAQEAHYAERHDFIDDEDQILTYVSLGPFRKCIGPGFAEEILEEDLSHESALEKAKALHFGVSLVDEINRIYADVPRGYFGHPVHYIIQSDDETMSTNVAKLLSKALMSVGRLKSRRITIMKQAEQKGNTLFDLEEPDLFNIYLAKALSSRQGGGAFVSFPGKLVHDTELLNGSQADIKEFAKLINECRDDTLLITVFDKSDNKSAELLQDTLNDMCFITITDNVVFKDEAITILKEMAESKGIAKNESLLNSIENKKEGYYIADLESLFRKWNEKRLRDDIYTQYSDFYKPRVLAEKPKGDAYQELNALIGLSKAKDVIKQALDFNKLRKMNMDAGVPLVNMSRHMVFTGNPGTAKTTVARLFARIMKDNNILPVGKLVEVGRKDLVGKYVGWTAQLVEETFKKACGSVLFIDEAYSLCEERAGLYGDEAINTIVQMMENHREDTIVILAGYPDKMEELLSRNPGLRSRISFHVNFDDYSSEDLIKILHLMADEKKRTLSEGVDERVLEIINREIGNKDFGNGRFIRNLFEQALMRQASRIVSTSDSVPDFQVMTSLIADDFGNPEDYGRRSTRREIGFAC